MVEKCKSLRDQQKPEKKWVWGDEIDEPQAQSEKEYSGKTYTSVAELLADEEEAEIERLEEFFRKLKAMRNSQES